MFLVVLKVLFGDRQARLSLYPQGDSFVFGS